MNEHIEFVKEWLADPTSKTQAELESNAKAADAALANAPDLAAAAASNAADAALANAPDLAAYWVKYYEEIVK